MLQSTLQKRARRTRDRGAHCEAQFGVRQKETGCCRPWRLSGERREKSVAKCFFLPQRFRCWCWRCGSKCAWLVILISSKAWISAHGLKKSLARRKRVPSAEAWSPGADLWHPELAVTCAGVWLGAGLRHPEAAHAQTAVGTWQETFPCCMDLAAGHSRSLALRPSLLGEGLRTKAMAAGHECWK